MFAAAPLASLLSTSGLLRDHTCSNKRVERINSTMCHTCFSSGQCQLTMMALTMKSQVHICTQLMSDSALTAGETQIIHMSLQHSSAGQTGIVCLLRYTSEVYLKPGEQVISKVFDSTLFDHLDSTWDFKVGPSPSSTWLTFSVDFGFKSPLYRSVAAVFFEEVRLCTSALLSHAACQATFSILMLCYLCKVALWPLNQASSQSLVNHMLVDQCTDILSRVTQCKKAHCPAH